MTELAGVAVTAVQQSTVADDATLDGVAHDERHQVGHIATSTDPALREHASSARGADDGRQPGQVADPLPQLEPLPDR